MVSRFQPLSVSTQTLLTNSVNPRQNPHGRETVDKKYNLKFYNLINEFFKITKIPLILNTSFNIQGEPIVCSIEDAIKNFYLSGLDKMYIGDFEISK